MLLVRVWKSTHTSKTQSAIYWAFINHIIFSCAQWSYPSFVCSLSLRSVNSRGVDNHAWCHGAADEEYRVNLLDRGSLPTMDTLWWESDLFNLRWQNGWGVLSLHWYDKYYALSIVLGDIRTDWVKAAVSAPTDAVRRVLLFHVRRHSSLNKSGQLLLGALQVCYIPIDDFYRLPPRIRRSLAWFIVSTWTGFWKVSQLKMLSIWRCYSRRKVRFRRSFVEPVICWSLLCSVQRVYTWAWD